MPISSRPPSTASEARSFASSALWARLPAGNSCFRSTQCDSSSSPPTAASTTSDHWVGVHRPFSGPRYVLPDRPVTALSYTTGERNRLYGETGQRPRPAAVRRLAALPYAAELTSSGRSPSKVHAVRRGTSQVYLRLDQQVCGLVKSARAWPHASRCRRTACGFRPPGEGAT